MSELVDAIAARSPRHPRSPIRRGKVTAIDTGPSPKLYTVNGRPMPSIEIAPSLALGDEVVYADQYSPIIIGRIQL